MKHSGWGFGRSGEARDELLHHGLACPIHIAQSVFDVARMTAINQRVSQTGSQSDWLVHTTQ